VPWTLPLTVTAIAPKAQLPIDHDSSGLSASLWALGAFWAHKEGASRDRLSGMLSVLPVSF